jgi:hypothetical protein
VDAVNSSLVAESLHAQVLDKGFDKFTRHFKESVPVTAKMRVEAGYGQKFGWAVYLQQEYRK